MTKRSAGGPSAGADPHAGRRRFAPRWWAVAAWLVVATAMLGLGRWQLERADEKIRLIDAAAAARAAEPVDVRSLDDPEAAAAAYRRVRAEGRWLAERQFLWDNRARAGRPGLEVVTPLRLDDGRVVLVNRGWTPLPTLRSELPDVAVPGVPASDAPSAVSPDVLPDVPSDGVGTEGPVVLTGLASRPSQGFSGGAAFVESAPWPRWLQHFDYDALGDALGATLVPLVLQPERGGPADAALLVENWQPAASGPEKHWSYAVQWFAMAAALTGLFVFANLRRPDGVDDPEPADAGAAPDPGPEPAPEPARPADPFTHPRTDDP